MTLQGPWKLYFILLLLSAFLHQESSAQQEGTLDTVFHEKGLSLVDYELLYEKEYLFLVRYAKWGKYHEKLMWRRPGKRDVQLVVDGECERLRRDCMGNPYLETPKKVVSIDLGVNEIRLTRAIGKKTFKRNLVDCYGYFGGKFLYPAFKLKRKQVDPMSNEFKRGKRHKKVTYFQIMASKSPQQEGKIFREIRGSGGDMVRKTQGNLYLFLPRYDRFEVYDQQFDSIAAKSFPFLEYFGWPRMKGGIRKDGVTEHFYIKYEQDRQMTFNKFDTEKGDTTGSPITLPVSSPKSVNIRKGWFYFIHHEPGEYGKGLYRFRPSKQAQKGP